MSRTTILFLCVANSSRSQMAEGLARQMAPSGVEVLSAGSAPTSLNPYAVEVMREIGIDIRHHRSKSVSEIPHDRIGTVITLCAEEVCPVFLTRAEPAKPVSGTVERLHWPFADPAAQTGSDQEKLLSFRRVRDQIRDAVATYFGV